jgi:hypothetical protein
MRIIILSFCLSLGVYFSIFAQTQGIVIANYYDHNCYSVRVL